MDSHDRIVDLLRLGKAQEAFDLLDKEKPSVERDFLLVSAYLGLNRLEEAHDLFFARREEFYDYRPAETIKANFDLRFLACEIAEAYSDIAYFNEKPYVNQEVEEILRSLPGMVGEHLSKPKETKLDLSLFEEGDDHAVLAMLSRLDPNKLDEATISAIRKLATDEGRARDLRTYALLLLKAAKDETPLIYKVDGSEYRLIPHLLEDPFKESSRLRLLEMLSREKDAAEARVGLVILDQAVVASYPEPYPGEGNEEKALAAIKREARRFLGDEMPLESEEERRLHALLNL